MSQDTIVHTLDRGAIEQLEERLRSTALESRTVPHARWSLKGSGFVATLYKSGKLVVQGGQAGEFVTRYLPGDTPATSRPTKLSADRVGIGSDEAGKGDYFGPLVVAAVRLGPGEAGHLRQGGVMDSKKLTDEMVHRLAGPIRDHFEHAVELLDPPDYNRTHAEVKNLNPMLADLHAQAIRRLAQTGDDILIDQFARKELLETRLSDLDVTVRQEPRGERDVAVAAASIVARAVFLERLAALSEEAAVDLHKGAGPPTDRAGRAYVAIHGKQALGSVAKLHFKNTSRVG